jgi:large subunit ribosomal protein L7/L12
MTVLELNNLVKALEAHYGVSAAAVAMPMARRAAGGARGRSGRGADRVHRDVDLVRRQEDQRHQGGARVTNLGLKEAKDLVEGAPAP